MHLAMDRSASRDDKLPLPPPDSSFVSPPPPPPKHYGSEQDAHGFLNSRLPEIETMSSLSSQTGFATPLTPNTPISPTNLSHPNEGKPKKSNPLSDLIDTEKQYVEQLTGIIRKIAAAWSRSNLPPPDLDTMFRSIEAVYKANRGLHSKLKEIGSNPSSPKALGDLLMRWIDDLEAPYSTYCTKYRSGFDTWDPVQSNPKLAPLIATFSASSPPPPSALLPDSADLSLWTLDALFLLPKARLKYYKKLYSRLLKSTAPGRSDHRLLVGALETLDGLLETLEQRASVQVGFNSPVIGGVETEDEVVVDMRSPPPAMSGITDTRPSSGSSSARGSSLSGGTSERLSRETANTSISRGSTATLSMPISDLERRLATQRTLDIFTMKPKAVRLQMNPPSLTYTRELRLSTDVVIRFTPNATGEEVIHRRGHIFLLSDLFLVCERMTPGEQARDAPDGADMWLCYPPLAGKVLRISEVSGQDNALQIAIMRKETLTLEAESLQMRNHLLSEFRQCIDFANSAPPISKQPPPPMPSLPQSQMAPPPYENDSTGPMVDSMNRLQLSPEAQMQQGAQRVPAMHEPLPGPMYPRVSSTAQSYPNPASDPPMPPARSTSFGSTSYPDAPRPSPSMAPHPPTQPGPPLHAPVPTHFNASTSFGRPLPPQGPQGALPPGATPLRPPSEPSIPRERSAPPAHQSSLPPVPSFPGGHPPNGQHFIPRSSSYGNLRAPQPRPLLPSVQFTARSVSMAEPSFDEPSPPNSPIEETAPTGPVTSKISANFKCKVFLQQQHAQWKSLGSAKLKLYHQDPTNIKQLVVEAENKEKTVLISTIVLTDGVERVGKTGVAIELSDKGARTGIVYMIQLRNEKSAGGLFDSLLAGSDRAAVKG
ncbi:hypothetical protein BD779DRAFT_26630 [Infundibulicybe gibba]|nr:hypothetical protein BD779DRAFT_26630 [Infundibulicybe gibba]